MSQNQHWTGTSPTDFAFWISSDFTAQIETHLEKQGIGKSELANLLGVTLPRVSQVLNNPGNLTLANVVKYPRALGLKVAIVIYDDGDPSNEKGPISAEIFQDCWRRAGKPNEMFSLSSAPARQTFYRPKNAGLLVMPKADWGQGTDTRLWVWTNQQAQIETERRGQYAEASN